MANFAGFDVEIDRNDGSQPIPVPGAVVQVRDVTDADAATGAGAIALPNVIADVNGLVASGTLPVAAGRTIRFTWVRDADGWCASLLRVTS